MTATNGRADPATIFSPTDALVGAAQIAKTAVQAAAFAIQEGDPVPDGALLADAAKLAEVVQGLCVYAATVGKWAAR